MKRTESSGNRLLAWLDAEFAFDPVEQELAVAAAACLDNVAELRRQLEAAGVVVEGSMGQPRVHPALAEIRGELDLFRRLIRDLALPADVEPSLKAVVG